jgi:hypothetical protein
MALTRSLKNMYEPVVDRAIKTGGWGETKIVHDPSVVTDALFQKAQLELGIANLQADFGLKAASIKGDLAMKSADINLRKDLALADMQFQRDMMTTSFAEQITAAAGGALSGYATAKNLGVSPVAGAIIGGGMAYGGAVAGRQQMSTTGGILNDMANASQIVAQQRKEKTMSDAWSTQMQRLNELNSKMTSRDAMSNPELAQQFHRERQMALADMYKTSVEGGMNPGQAAQWTQYMDELTSGKTQVQSTEEKTSAAFQRYMSSDKGPKATKQFQLESQAAWIEARIAKGESIPGSAMDSFMKLSGQQGLPAGQIEEQFDPKAADKNSDRNFQREMQEDRQAHQREMQGGKGSSSKGGKANLEGAFNDFLNSDMTPEDEKQFRVKAEAAMIAKNLNSGRPVDPRQIDEFVAKARGGEIVPDSRDVTPQVPQKKSISANQKVADKNQNVVPQLNKVASGQEEIQIGTPQGQVKSTAPAKQSKGASGSWEEEEKRSVGTKVKDFVLNIPGPMDFKEKTAGRKWDRMIHGDTPEAQEKIHQKKVAEARKEAEKEEQQGVEANRRIREEREARYPKVREERQVEVQHMDKAEAVIAELPEENQAQQNKKSGLMDKAQSVKNLDRIIEEVPDTAFVKLSRFAKEHGIGIKSPHLSVEAVDQLAEMLADDRGEEVFSDKEQALLTEYLHEIKNLSYADLLADSGARPPSIGQVNENLKSGNVINFNDGYREASQKLMLQARDVRERLEGATTRQDLEDDEFRKKKRWHDYQQSTRGARRVGPGRIESPF